VGELWLFVGALCVAYLLPGPDMVLILQTASVRGHAHALAAAGGLALARATHVVLAALGLGALLRTSPMAFDILRLIGAAWLVWLGIGIVRLSASHVEADALEPRTSLATSYVGSARRGLVTNISNPKALIFCSLLLPQFVAPGMGSAAGQFATLGAVLLLVGAIFDIAFAFGGLVLQRLLAGQKGAESVVSRVLGSLMIAFGLVLAVG